MDQVFVNKGAIDKDARKMYSEGVDKVLELVVVTSLQDSLNCTKEGGIVYMTGLVGGKWSLDRPAPMDFIPTAVSLTTYAGGNEDFNATLLDEMTNRSGATLKVLIGKIFRLAQIVKTHRMMDENRAGTKIVVLT